MFQEDLRHVCHVLGRVRWRPQNIELTTLTSPALLPINSTIRHRCRYDILTWRPTIEIAIATFRMIISYVGSTDATSWKLV